MQKQTNMDVEDLNNTISKLNLMDVEIGVCVCMYEYPHIRINTHITLPYSTEYTFFSSMYGAFTKFICDYRASFNEFYRF